MTRNSPGQRMRTHSVTTKNLRIEIREPEEGASRSANPQHPDRRAFPSIETEVDIKQEPHEEDLTPPLPSLQKRSQLPLRSRSSGTTCEPPRTTVEPQVPNIFAAPLPFVAALAPEAEVLVTSSAVEETSGLVATDNCFDQDEIIVPSSWQFVDEPSPSPSPNSPMIRSPANESEASLEPIIYEDTDDEDELQSTSIGEYVQITKKRRLSRNAPGPTDKKGWESVDDSEVNKESDDGDDNVKKTPSSKRIRTLSPSTERLLSGRHQLHIWNMWQREAIFLLKRFTTFSWDEIAILASHLFVQDGSLPLSLRMEQVNSQWAEWSKAFCAERRYGEEERWEKRRASFEATALQCRLELRLATRRTEPSVQTKGKRHHQHKADIRKWLKSKDSERKPLIPEPRTPEPPTRSPIISSPLQGLSTVDNGNAFFEFIQSPETPGETCQLQENFSERSAGSEFPTDSLSGLEVQVNKSPRSVNPQSSPASQGPAIVTSSHFTENSRAPPRLVFRVYHSGMPGQNSFRGFRSGRHSQVSLEGDIPPPHDHGQLLLEAAIHFKRQPFSSFVATTTSLIWAIYKALEFERDSLSISDSRIGHPHIALIDTQKLPRSSHVFDANSLIRDIRKDARLKNDWRSFAGCGYRAAFEWIVWADIPANAVLCSVPLSRLTTSAFPLDDTAVPDLISIPYLRERANSRHTMIRARNSLISTTARCDLCSEADGIALGRLAVLFGFSSPEYRDLLPEFVHALCQGWAMAAHGDDAIQEVVYGFVAELERATGGIVDVPGEVASVCGAVTEGITRANKDVEKERRYADKESKSPRRWRKR